MLFYTIPRQSVEFLGFVETLRVIIIILITYKMYPKKVHIFSKVKKITCIQNTDGHLIDRYE